MPRAALTLTSPRPAVLLAAGAVAAAALVLAPPPLGPPTRGRQDGAPGRATVARVIDGDTVVLAIGGAEEPARLIGIDTPESVAPGRPVECYGPEASARLGDLLPPGTAVDVTRDVEPRDRYDRLLVYLHRTADGLFVNAAQVADGYAEASDFPPNSAHRTELSRAEHPARTAGLGLWGACGGPDVAAEPPG
jgi:endonuclease YncB( thermonuclease family)